MWPLEVRLIDDRRTLVITWDDGSVSRLPAQLLRHNSRAASNVRAGIDGTLLVPDSEIKLNDVRLIGSYAVQISFSDNHDRGIYPWSYLRELASAVFS